MSRFERFVNKRTGGRLDMMFNNAGMAVGGSFDAVPFEKILDMVNVNLVGVMIGIYAAIPLLKKTENSLCFTTSSSSATFGSRNSQNGFFAKRRPHSSPMALQDSRIAPFDTISSWWILYVQPKDSQ